jgi:hypothetical protein
MKKEDIQHYLNNFRRELSKYLKPDFNLKAIIFPSNEGAIIEFEFRKDQPTRDEFKKHEALISDQLRKVNISSLATDNSSIKFSGTNTFLEPGKIFIIKDNNQEEWSTMKAAEDVKKLINPQS